MSDAGKWVLRLNDMRSSNYETLTPVCYADTQEELQELVEAEKVDHYSDEHWVKGFKRGGPLEWFNPPSDSFQSEHYVTVPSRIVVYGFIEFRDPVIVNFPSCQSLKLQSPIESTVFEPALTTDLAG